MKGATAMIDTCANPQCGRRLIYLRSGVLYAVDLHRDSTTHPETHFYWLCETCAFKHRLKFSAQGDPELVPVDSPDALCCSKCADNRVRRVLVKRLPGGSLEATEDPEQHSRTLRLTA